MIRKILTTAAFFLVAGSVQAVPVLEFSGPVSFDATTKELTTSSTTPSVLDFTSGLSVIPDLSTSVVEFGVVLTTPVFDLGSTIAAGFTGLGATPHISVKADTNNDSFLDTILEGNFIEFFVFGTEGETSGRVEALIEVTGGIADFNPGQADVFALQFNLTDDVGSPVVWSTSTYDNNFNAIVDGSITAVSEPTTLALSSLLLVAAVSRRKHSE